MANLPDYQRNFSVYSARKTSIFDKKQVSEQFFGGENMSKKMSSCPSRVYTGFRAKR
jgi:hypothetical protein